MKHDKIDDKARVWMIVKGSDGKLHEELDPRFLVESVEEAADVMIRTAGKLELAETRLW